MDGKIVNAIIWRVLAVFAAFIVGWIIYMIAMILTVYDGILSMIFQPFMAIICSGIVVTMTVLVGLVLKLPLLSRLWTATPALAIAMIAGSLFLLCFGSQLGIVETYTDPETHHSFQGLHSVVALSAYFAILFAIANWPFRTATPSQTDKMNT
jgi:hypothetical protein